MKFFLPKESRCSQTFLQQILKRTKKGLKHLEVDEIRTPNYPELGVSSVYEAIKSDVALLEYLPDPPRSVDGVARKYMCDKKFFWTVIATLRPTFYSRVIDQAKTNREALSA